MFKKSIGLILFYFCTLQIVFCEVSFESESFDVETSNLKPKEKITSYHKLVLSNLDLDQKKAMKYVVLALNESIIINDYKNIIIGLEYMGQIKEIEGKYEESLSIYFAILKYLEKENDEVEISVILNNIGVIYFYLKDYEKAAKYWESALYFKTKTNEKTGIPIVLNNLASTYGRLEQFEKALQYSEKALKLFEEEGDKKNMAATLGNIGVLYHRNFKDRETAKKYYLAAIQINEENNYQSGLIPNYLNIGVAYHEDSLFVEALEFLKKSIQIAETYNSKIALIKAYENIGKVYAEMEDFENAYFYQNEHKNLTDSILSLNVQNQITEIEHSFKKEKEKIIQESNKLKMERTKERLIFWLIVSFSISIILICILIVFKQNKKAKEILAQEKSKFFSNIVHEFRTPVTLITGPIEQVLSGDLNPNHKKHLELAHRNSNQLLSLVNQLLDISKLETGKEVLNESNADIVEFTLNIGNDFGLLAEEKRIKLAIEVPESSIWACFDQDKMAKIISNLLSNAIKYTNSEGEILLKLSIIKIESIPYLEFIFKDTGVGISKENQSKIFERFYRIDNHEIGNGIGLSLVRDLVYFMGGEIQLFSEVNQGTRFNIKIPFKKADSFIESDEKQIIPTEIVDEKDKLEILIIDDNKDMLNYLGILFKEKKFKVSIAENGQEGFEKAKQLIPDIIVSDIMMPLIDGVQLVNLLKNDELTNHIPVVLLSAKNSLETRLAGIDKGADNYLSKPFHASELISIVNNLIQSRKQLELKYKSNTSDVKNVPNSSILTSKDLYIQKIIQIIEENIEDELFGVEELSFKLSISRTQLHRKLKATTNITATEIIRIVKLEKAMQYLQTNAGNITEIAYMLGFSSQPYFSKCFADYFGVSPKEIKKLD